MLIVENDTAKVEADLAEGRLSCPSCRGVLAAWFFARRRFVRAETGPLELRPRRGRCRGRAKTHVLLPDAVVCRRVDAVAVIGRALVAAAKGTGWRRVAVLVGRPFSNGARVAAPCPVPGGRAGCALPGPGRTASDACSGPSRRLGPGRRRRGHRGSGPGGLVAHQAPAGLVLGISAQRRGAAVQHALRPAKPS